MKVNSVQKNPGFGISDKLAKKVLIKRMYAAHDADMAFQNAPYDEEIVKKLNRAYFSASKKYNKAFNLIKAKLAKTNRGILDLASVKN